METVYIEENKTYIFYIEPYKRSQIGIISDDKAIFRVYIEGIESGFRFSEVKKWLNIGNKCGLTFQGKIKSLKPYYDNDGLLQFCKIYLHSDSVKYINHDND